LPSPDVHGYEVIVGRDNKITVVPKVPLDVTPDPVLSAPISVAIEPEPIYPAMPRTTAFVFGVACLKLAEALLQDSDG
jgi:hypothetical protein